MLKAGIHHQPESADISLVSDNQVSIRIKTACNDIKQVTLISADSYALSMDRSGKRTEMTYLGNDSIYDYWQITIEQVTKRLAYAFLLKDEQKNQILYGDQRFYEVNDTSLHNGSNFFKLPYFHMIDSDQGPAWVKETVWYQIFPERFANGDKTNDPKDSLPWQANIKPAPDSFFGGDLQGIIDHLDYLQDLGINGLYLTPIFSAPTNHKYDTTDYYEIDTTFGNKETLHTLIAEAHKRHMHVMLDAVFNHIGDKSPIWQDVITNGQNSRYAEWFHINQFPVAIDEQVTDATFEKHYLYDTFAFTPHMPKWNTSNVEVQQYLINVAKYWVENFDIDAWRLDVANEVDHHFWRAFRSAMVKIKPDIYILGEIWHTAQAWLDGSQFDGVMNYAYMQHIKDFFLTEQQSPQNFINQLKHELMLYSDQTNRMMFNLLDSHDTARIKTIAKNDEQVVKELLAFMFIQPGTPDIYYGTELGMVGGDDPDNRRPMDWQKQDDENAMYNYMKKLIGIRHAYADILSDGRIEFSTDGDGVIVQRIKGNHIIKGIFATNAKLMVNLESTAKVLLGTLDEGIYLAPKIAIIYEVL